MKILVKNKNGKFNAKSENFHFPFSVPVPRKIGKKFRVPVIILFAKPEPEHFFFTEPEPFSDFAEPEPFSNNKNGKKV